ncbi:MAG: CPBP family intramembrane metalloprotease [Ruminococcaceae bacterium]|nr:CPBP family intramembrane metalloprotease [Oscillospiraceae bacterium]
MKKTLITIVKILLFFIGWAVLLVAGEFIIPDSPGSAVWRFLSELVPFLSAVLFTALFWLIEKRRIKPVVLSSPLKNTAIGILAGVIWIGIAAAVLMLSGTMKITAYNSVPMLWLWALSVFINAAMQELLVRGYLFQMLKTDYNVAIATIITTALFTFMHGGAFEAGVIPVVNVLTMSLLMTIVLEYTGSLIVPAIMHFIWNFIGGIILGGVVLAEDYPNLYVTEFGGNILLTGGAPKMEGSIAVLILNILLIFVFSLLIKKKKLKV